MDNEPTMEDKLKSEGYKSLRVDNYLSKIIVDALALSAGLDFAVASIGEQYMTKGCRNQLRNLIAQTLNVFCYPYAFKILSDEGLLEKQVTEVGDLLYRFDLPDDSHKDLVIYYKDKPILDS